MLGHFLSNWTNESKYSVKCLDTYLYTLAISHKLTLQLTRIGHQGLLRVGVGVLMLVGDALGVVDDVLREEDF